MTSPKKEKKKKEKKRVSLSKEGEMYWPSPNPSVYKSVRGEKKKGGKERKREASLALGSGAHRRKLKREL